MKKGNYCNKCKTRGIEPWMCFFCKRMLCDTCFSAHNIHTKKLQNKPIKEIPVSKTIYINKS